MSVECEIVKAITFNCINCGTGYVVKQLFKKEFDEAGYAVMVEYCDCDECGVVNRVIMQVEDYEREFDETMQNKC